jgi:hypothetical protein
MKCDAISETVYGTFPSTDSDPTIVRNWIKEHYTSASLKEGSDVTGQTWFYWPANQKIYQAAVAKEGSALVVSWGGRKPTLKEVIRCLGAPEYYSARIILGSQEGPSREVDFGIWYPAQRLVLSTSWPGTRLVVNDGTSFDVLTVTRSDAARLNKVRPWPTDLNDLQVDPLEK